MVAAAAENSRDCFRSILGAPFHHKKLLFFTVLLLLFYTTAGKNVRNKNFDYFVFSQRWLPTSCIEYIEHSSSNSASCVLPRNYDFWAIHGLWPTQNNHMGPFYCNRSMSFDEKKLHPIEQDLKSYWPNIEGGQTVSSLWQHEWEKHGTCAAEIQSLDSELKYFNTTLGFFKSYSMNDIFQKYSVVSDDTAGVSVDDLFKMVKDTAGTLPQIHCIHDVKTNLQYLEEIRLCFNKNLKLMDCGRMNRNRYNSVRDLTNCPVNAKIIYPSSINPHRNKIGISNKYFNTLLDLLHFLRFLMWASI